MFESDDFDQVLSQFDFPELASVKLIEKENKNTSQFAHNLKTKSHPDLDGVQPPNCMKTKFEVAILPCSPLHTPVKNVILSDNHSTKVSDSIIEKAHKNQDQPSPGNKGDNPKLGICELPNHNKRKIINSYFDHQSKRKFPGPAGLLTETLEISKDESICQIELLSQDIDYTQHNLRRDLFESPIWSRLLSDTHTWNLDIDSINTIKQQALCGNLRRRKAQSVTAFVEAVDRSAIDPMIILRDATGSIKCTLHRDAWSTFSQYIVSDCCALILQKPTVLTTGAAFKKHYLNITLSNILAIYSSTVLSADGSRTLPDGYNVVYEDDFTVINTEQSSDLLGTSLDHNNGAEDLTDGLDSFFSDDIF